MFACKNGWQFANKFMIAVFALIVAYMCVWPWTITNSSHTYEDQSYKRYGGMLSKPLYMTNTYSGENITLEAGTAVIYEFNDSGKPEVIHIWDDEITPDYGGLIDHSYPRTTVSTDYFANPDEVDRNYQEYITVSKIEHEKNQEQMNYAKKGFVPSQLIIAIPVGIVLWILLILFEDRFERKHIFTIGFGIFLLIFLAFYISQWTNMFICR